MPNKKSSKKHLRKSSKKNSENTNIKNKTKDLIKKTKKAAIDKKPEAKKDFDKVVKAIDKMAKRGIIKKNTAARKKSRLQKKINSL